MKRIAITITALVCALCCIFGMTACGDDKVVPVTDITINKVELRLNEGETETLKATVTPKNATNKTVTWTSDNPDYVRVSKGKITALKVGWATVTATAGGKSATCVVTVTLPKMTSAEWAACVAELEKSTNYTETRTNNANDEDARTIMRDGTKYFEEVIGGETNLYEKTGATYTHYHKANSSADWTQTAANEQEYIHALAETFKGEAVQILLENYEKMDYDGIKYSLASVDLDGVAFTDIAVYMDDKNITAVTFNVQGDYVKIGNIGKTEISIPTV